jgi:hypothetical protein
MTMDVVVKCLAVLGAGVGGGFGLGLVAQLLMRATMVRKPPRWSVLLVRVLSAVICGWLVALWLFGGGGPGIGGSGGWGFGSGSGKENGEQATEIGKKNKDGKAKEDTKNSSPEESLRIEVLGKDALSESNAEKAQWYRIDTKDGEGLFTFAQVKELVEKRQQEQPPLRRIEIVLYKDSPEERVSIVSRLRLWVGDQYAGKIKTDISRLDNNASRK